MNFSIFNKFLGIKTYNIVLKKISEEGFRNYLSSYVNDAYILSKGEKEIFYGKIEKNSFELEMKKKLFNTTHRYKVKGTFFYHSNSNTLKVLFRFDIVNFNFRHLSISVAPTLIFIYIFSNYSIQYMIFPIIYFLLSDFLINFIKIFYNTNNLKNFTSLFNNIRQ